MTVNILLVLFALYLIGLLVWVGANTVIWYDSRELKRTFTLGKDQYEEEMNNASKRIRLSFLWPVALIRRVIKAARNEDGE